jgi:hypothetical protein
MWFMAGGLMEDLDVDGGVTPSEKISIITMLNLYVMHVCDA